MSLTADVIRSRIATDVLPEDLPLLTGLISDALPVAAGLEAIDATIATARVTYSPLFRGGQAVAAAAGGTEVNPFLPASRNLTQQAILMKKAIIYLANHAYRR